jgi:hypothetical protein
VAEYQNLSGRLWSLTTRISHENRIQFHGSGQGALMLYLRYRHCNACQWVNVYDDYTRNIAGVERALDQVNSIQESRDGSWHEEARFTIYDETTDVEASVIVGSETSPAKVYLTNLLAALRTELVFDERWLSEPYISALSVRYQNPDGSERGSSLSPRISNFIEGLKEHSVIYDRCTYFVIHGRDTPFSQTILTVKNGVITYALPAPSLSHLPALAPPSNDKEPEIMTTSTPIAPESRPADMMAKISITREKSSNKLVLSVDAKPLHDLLESIGVAIGADGNYKERPVASFSTVERGVISTELLLRRQYPVNVNLSGVYPRPPTVQQLQELCGSAHAQIRTILQHYQPIDISVTISKRLVK